MKSALIILGAGIATIAVLVIIAFWLIDMLDRALAAYDKRHFISARCGTRVPGTSETGVRAFDFPPVHGGDNG